MEHELANKRKESRYPLATQAILERDSGEQLSASTLNVSGSGMLVELDRAPELHLGEQLRCSVLLYDGKPPQCWGLGTVIRLEKSKVAIEFKCASLLGDFE